MPYKGLAPRAICISAALIAMTLTAWTPSAAPLAQQTLAPALTGTPQVPQTTATPRATAAPRPTNSPRTPPRAGAAQAAKLLALFRARGLETGTVTANDQGTLVLARGKQTSPVASRAETLVLIPGNPSARVSDIRIGDHVAALMQKTSAGIGATLIVVLPSNYTTRNIVVGGVQRVDAGSLTVRVGSKTRRVGTDAATQVVRVTGTQPSITGLADIRRGDVTLLVGQANGAGVQAQLVILYDRSALPGRLETTPTPTSTPRPN